MKKTWASQIPIIIAFVSNIHSFRGTSYYYGYLGGPGRLENTSGFRPLLFAVGILGSYCFKSSVASARSIACIASVTIGVKPGAEDGSKRLECGGSGDGSKCVEYSAVLVCLPAHRF